MGWHLRSMTPAIALAIVFTLAPGVGEANDGASDLGRIAELQSALFDPMLSGDEIDRLLAALRDPAGREAAARQLSQQGQGHQERIIASARRCPDLEARQACADAVEALDSAYRNTEPGRQLGALYRKHARTLLPPSWARFRKDPLDLGAVAMLMHANAEEAYAWLGASEDRHDRVRYLLLRIRELSPDDFAAKHIYEHTAGGVKLALVDVFPDAGRHRVVGHVVLGRIALQAGSSRGPDPFGPGSPPIGGLPGIKSLQFDRRVIYLFSYPPYGSGRPYRSAGFAETHFYNRERERTYITPRKLRTASREVPGLCPLPELKLTGDQELRWVQNNYAVPWWAGPYVPSAYREWLPLQEKPAGAVPPEVVRAEPPVPAVGPRGGSDPAAPLDPAAPSLVFLPPRLGPEAGEAARAAAELLCDRLAQEVVAAGAAQVVDRTQLGRLLAERKLADVSSSPLVSYDAMVRLEVDPADSAPQVHLGLIDLSNGNVVARKSFAWPVDQSDVGPMMAVFRAAFEKLKRPGDGRLRVRFLGVEQIEANVRLKSRKLRLGEVFRDALARSERIELVEHLEAGTAQEESLLLMLGLSRLPGGRQFVPQADATVELRLEERDAVGKSFEETPVEIGLRLRQGADYRGDWAGTAGPVRDFDALIRQAWQKLAGSLAGARPEAAAESLGAMALRRRQAEAELEAARALFPLNQWSDDLETCLARLAHTEAAAKLDPSFEEAAYEQIVTLGTLSFRGRNDPRVFNPSQRVVQQAQRYFERFGDHPAHRNRIHDMVRVAVHGTLGSLRSEGSIALTPARRQMLQSARKLAECAVRDWARVPTYDYYDMMVCIVYRGMRLEGTPLHERQAWIDKILALSHPHLEGIRAMTDDFYRRSDLNDYYCVQYQAAALAAEDLQFDRARALIARMRQGIDRGDVVEKSLVERIRGVIIALDDAEALAEFDRWVEKREASVVGLLAVGWPELEFFQDRQRVGRDMTRVTMPTVRSTAIRYKPLPKGRPHTGISALAEGDRRLYLVMAGIGWGHFAGESSSSRPQVLGSIPLDEQGKPVGNTVHVVQPVSNDLWDTVTLLPPPETHGALHVLDAKVLGGKLTLGTLRSGLLVFDPATERWQTYGPEQGLPEWSVYTVFPLDEQRLLLTGQSSHRIHVYYTLDLGNGKVTLLHRTDRQQTPWFDTRPRYLWRNGEKLMGWCNAGLQDDLLGPGAAFHKVRRRGPYGWAKAEYSPIEAVAEVAGRRFLSGEEGLDEFDPAGKIVRSWWRGCNFQPAGSDRSIGTPADCPIRGRKILTSGRLLVFVDDRDSALVGFDPATETWYGPLRVDQLGDTRHALGTAAGLWVGTGWGLSFVALDDFLARAEEEGRVVTTAEFHRRRAQMIDALPPLEQAKLAFGMHQLDRAAELLDGVLAADPNHAEALMLTGWLHEPWCTNRPEKALECYRRMAGLRGNRIASFSGMYLEFDLLIGQKKWQEALALGDEIVAAFPQRQEYCRRHLDWWRNHIRKSEPSL